MTRTIHFKFLLSLLLLAIAFPALAETNAVSKYENEIHAFEVKDRTNPPPQHAILFLGSSTIRKWKTLAEDFPGKTVINRGFGGSQIADSTEFADRIVFPYDPKIIVFYAGDNDLAAGKSPDQVVANYEAFVKKVHARLPDTRIIYISIKACNARWRLRDKIVKVNDRIQAMTDPELSFVNIYPLMLGDDGKPRKDLLLADGLHPSRECYKLWAPLITAAIDKKS
jgi:lysophospholipase L1-like esterase